MDEAKGQSGGGRVVPKVNRKAVRVTAKTKLDWSLK